MTKIDQTISWLRELATEGGKGVVNNIDARCLGRIADELERLSRPAQGMPSHPIAWIVKWSTKHTPENVSAYLSEADAKRAAANVRMYADASDVVVIPTFAEALALPSTSGQATEKTDGGAK